MELVETYKESIIQKKSFDFAVEIVYLYKQLSKTNDSIILKQLLRSATSIGANVQEGSAGQTKKDFITKMSIASKEARETLYWLKLLSKTNYYPVDLEKYYSDCDELVKILTKIVKTSQAKTIKN
ncbi:MAG TPA: four helix bundle protein [Bacteroidia bacterium]|nr:four helix bundle protein [Bacteroidota bacterium]HRD37307.1 four helix bundle protein [Bacteroidia bacterium]